MELLEGREGILALVDITEGDRIYLLDLKTGDQERHLLSPDLDCSFPEIAADGSRVVYTQGSELVLRSLDGTKLKSFPGYHGRWWTAPDGEEWIYYSNQFALTEWPQRGGEWQSAWLGLFYAVDVH